MTEGFITRVALPVGLGAVMFAMGLSLIPADFARVVRQPRPIIAGLASLLVAVPLLGLAVGHLSPVAAPLAFGLFMIATCPGGTFSNLLTSYGGGDLALSITMTACGCLIYVFTAPFWVDLGLLVFDHGARHVSLDRLTTIVELGRIIVAPVIAGMVLRPWLGERARTVLESVTKNAAAIVVVSIFAWLLWKMRATFDPHVVPWVVILNLLTVLLGWMAARLAGLATRAQISVVCEHAVRQEGTAIFIVTSMLGIPAAAIPLTVNSFVGFGVGVLFILAHRIRGARA